MVWHPFMGLDDNASLSKWGERLTGVVLAHQSADIDQGRVLGENPKSRAAGIGQNRHLMSGCFGLRFQLIDATPDL